MLPAANLQRAFLFEGKFLILTAKNAKFAKKIFKNFAFFAAFAVN